jgi:hypothetical protein
MLWLRESLLESRVVVLPEFGLVVLVVVLVRVVLLSF